MPDYMSVRYKVAGVLLFSMVLLLTMADSSVAVEKTFHLVHGFNGVSIPFEGSGFTNAGELCQAIPSCESVSYWDAQTQGFVTHKLGSVENNFSLTPGYPYFVSVTQDSTFIATGTIPESVAFDLISTLTTSVNAITVPSYMSHIATAQKLADAVPNAETVWFWDEAGQGFVGHPIGTEINNFPVLPDLPYFISVTADGTLKFEVLRTTLGAAPTIGDIPLDVRFSANASGGGTPYLYSWDLNGDGLEDETRKDFTYTYQQPGDYNAMLTVTDAAGTIRSQIVTITAIQTNQSPIADPGGPYKGIVTVPLQFDGSKSSDPDGDPLTYSWNFGDGGTGSGVNPSHIYINPGVYTVMLTVLDGRGGSHTAQTTVEAVAATPTIMGFSPVEGTTGTKVVITGTNFDLGGLTVSFNGANAIISSYTASTITTSVPLGATTGTIRVTTTVGSAISSEPFTVLSQEDFNLTVTPASISIPSGGRASFVVSLDSLGTNGFSGLVELSAETVAGLTARFEPAYISINQNSVLNVNVNASLPSETALTIFGTAIIKAAQVTREATVFLNPLPSDTTTLTGQILATKDGKPIKGVTLTLGPLAAVTDDAGNFLFLDPPLEDQVLLINGESANHDGIVYPSAIPVPVTITGGQDNQLPYPVYLHEVNTKNFTVIDPSQDTLVMDPEIPHYEMLIPAGVVIRGWDGLTNEKISVKPIPVDRLPIKSPPDGVYVKEIYMYYFFKPGGGLPSQPIPVKMPNTFQAAPGTRVQLWYYDESPTPDPASNQWKPFGWGTVGDDGKQITPDPGVGIPKFCCGASFADFPLPDTPQPTPPDGCPNEVGDPVDPYSGMFVYNEDDIGFISPAGLRIQRLYNSGNGVVGPFGRGTSINYDHLLMGSGSALTYITPQGGRYIFSLNGDGSYTNSIYPFLRGAKAFIEADNSRTLRFKDGETYRFDGEGRLVRIDYRNGRWINIVRDGFGYITNVSDNFGNEFALDVVSKQIGSVIYRFVSSITFNSQIVRYNYDSYGKLVSVDYPDLYRKSYTYDSDNRLKTITNKRRIVEVTNEYDPGPKGKVRKQIHADGGIFNISYKAAGGTVTETAVTDANGETTSYRFNNAGYVVERTDPFGQTTLYDRAFGTNEQLTVSDALGRKTSYTYDENGNITSVLDPAGNTTSYEYDLIMNKPTKVRDALLRETILGYDGNGNLTSITDPLTNTTTIAYNTYGQPVSITNAILKTIFFEYDTYGNLIKVTDPLGNTSEMAFDNLGRLIRAIDAQKNETKFKYDLISGRIKEIIDANQNITSFSFDENGNILTVVDAKGQTTTYTYNLRDKVATMTDQLGRSETYIYDANDNLVSFIDRKGQVRTFSYDSKNRIERVDYADGSFTTYTYDAVGNLRFINDSISGPIEYNYSNTGCAACGGQAVDRLIQEIAPLGSISYEYDVLGRRTKMQEAGQEEVLYFYDANNRLESISTSNTALGILNFNFGYDALGRRTSLTYPNGITTSYTYDDASSLLTLKHLNSLNIEVEVLNYLYNVNGARSRMDRANVLPGLNNPVASNTYNQANEMMSHDADTMTYDENGNMTSVTNSCGMTTYIWDARNRLSGINGFKSDCSPLTASFKYDALGRRIEKTMNGKTIQYLYDGSDIVQEIENGIVSANYIGTLNIDEPLARIQSDGMIRYYQQDALGSVIVLTDESGNVKTTYSYDPFGHVTLSGEASDNPFQFAGRENDGTGLLYERNRYYSYELHRYISQDPIGLAGGDVNLYVRVGNNPVNWVDPRGLTWIYQQSTGNWSHVDDQTGATTNVGSGYAGAGAGLNNPDMQNIPNVGPLPQGGYTIGPQQNNVTNNGTQLPASMILTPDLGNNMYGRGGFLFHGDNPAQNQTASSGCPVGSRTLRNQVSGSGDNRLQVIP